MAKYQINVNLAMVGPNQVPQRDFAQLNSKNLLDIGGDFKPIQKSADGAMTFSKARTFSEAMSKWQPVQDSTESVSRTFDDFNGPFEYTRPS